MGGQRKGRGRPGRKSRRAAAEKEENEREDGQKGLEGRTVEAKGWKKVIRRERGARMMGKRTRERKRERERGEGRAQRPGEAALSLTGTHSSPVSPPRPVFCFTGN